MIASAVSSIVLYIYKKIMIRLSRRISLRICSDYNTVSRDATEIIAGRIPLDLLTLEQAERFRYPSIDRKALRAATVTTWQERWKAYGNGRWTFRIIPGIKRWMGRSFGRVDIYRSLQFYQLPEPYRENTVSTMLAIQRL